MADTKTLREALEALLRRDELNTCQHQNTHRGGAIWEICDDCGMQWADDRGGKPEWRDPPEWVAARAALAAQVQAEPVEPTDPEWIVNSLGELGVRISGRCFFLYKGRSIEYSGDETHDDGTQYMVRPVGKREFGETCKPIIHMKVENGILFDRTPYPYRQELVYTPGLSDGDPGDADWIPLAAAPRGGA